MFVWNNRKKTETFLGSLTFHFKCGGRFSPQKPPFPPEAPWLLVQVTPHTLVFPACLLSSCEVQFRGDHLAHSGLWSVTRHGPQVGTLAAYASRMIQAERSFQNLPSHRGEPRPSWDAPATGT